MVFRRESVVQKMQIQAGLDGSLPGDVGFDPLRLSELDWNMAEIIIPAASWAATPELPMLYWMREAELKHGRLCMLANSRRLSAKCFSAFS